MKFQVFFNVKFVTVYLSPLKILRDKHLHSLKSEKEKKNKKQKNKAAPRVALQTSA